jgi:hypothetical protein
MLNKIGIVMGLRGDNYSLTNEIELDDGFQQNYLKAYVFILNRRYFDVLFERVVIDAVSFRWNYLGERNG